MWRHVRILLPRRSHGRRAGATFVFVFLVAPITFTFSSHPLVSHLRSRAGLLFPPPRCVIKLATSFLPQACSTSRPRFRFAPGRRITVLPRAASSYHPSWTPRLTSFDLILRLCGGRVPRRTAALNCNRSWMSCALRSFSAPMPDRSPPLPPRSARPAPSVEKISPPSGPPIRDRGVRRRSRRQFRFRRDITVDPIRGFNVMSADSFEYPAETAASNLTSRSGCTTFYFCHLDD